MGDVAYAWREHAESEGTRAAKLPKGQHRVCISKVVYCDKTGMQYSSSGGDPQILLVFADKQARETTQMVTLSHKAGWTLAKLMGCFDPPANLARLEADGIEPQHFADQDFGDANLVNRQLTIDLDFEKGEDGKMYPRVTPVKVQGSSAASDTPPPADADEMPPVLDDDAPPPAGCTKEEAWAAVMEAWTQAVTADPTAKSRRTNAWAQAVRDVGKPEKSFTPEDWAGVATSASIPF